MERLTDREWRERRPCDVGVMQYGDRPCTHCGARGDEGCRAGRLGPLVSVWVKSGPRDRDTALERCLNELIAQRDVLYDDATGPGGHYDHDGDRAEVERLDAIIDEARAALGRSTHADTLDRAHAAAVQARITGIPPEPEL